MPDSSRVPLQHKTSAPARKTGTGLKNDDFQSIDEKTEAPDRHELMRALSDPLTATPQSILGLQATLGNRATGQIIQAKLSVGEAVNAYEREADQIALQAAKGNAVKPSITSLARKTPAQAETQPEGDLTGGRTERRINSRKGGGKTLPDETRVMMESQLGADFSGVRIHTGHEADQLNRDLSARAFTLGSSIFMAQGRYDPESQQGRQLLAHELTHVVQQGHTGHSTTAPATIQRGWFSWGKKKTEEKPAAATKPAARPGADAPDPVKSPDLYMQWLKTHPGLLSAKEREYLGVKTKNITMKDDQMAKFGAKGKEEQTRELQALGTGKGKEEGQHIGGEAGDVLKMSQDPRFQARYKVDRESDHGGFFSRKYKQAKESFSEAAASFKSHLPGGHSVVPGEDFETSQETTGQTVKRVLKTGAVIGAKKLASSIPLVGSGMTIASAVKEGERQKEAEKISDTAAKDKAKDSMATPLLQSMSGGLASEHHTQKIVKGAEGAIGMVSDLASVATAGVSQFGTAAAKQAVSSVAKPIIDYSVKGAKAGVKAGQFIAGALGGEREARLAVTGSKKESEKAEATSGLAAADPKFAQAMLAHLAPGQMSLAKELYTNTRIQEPTGDHTLKPSRVAELGRQENARLRERERMGAERTWSLEGEQQEAAQQKAAEKAAKATAQPSPSIPKAPALPGGPATKTKSGQRENLLGRLMRSEEKKWYES
jgi:hypothetical protein